MLVCMRDEADITFAEAWAAWLAYRSCGVRPLRLSTLAAQRYLHRMRPLAEAASRLSRERAQTLSGADPPPNAKVSVGINFA